MKQLLIKVRDKNSDHTEILTLDDKYLSEDYIYSCYEIIKEIKENNGTFYHYDGLDRTEANHPRNMYPGHSDEEWDKFYDALVPSGKEFYQFLTIKIQTIDPEKTVSFIS